MTTSDNFGGPWLGVVAAGAFMALALVACGGGATILAVTAVATMLMGGAAGPGKGGGLRAVAGVCAIAVFLASPFALLLACSACGGVWHTITALRAVK